MMTNGVISTETLETVGIWEKHGGAEVMVRHVPDPEAPLVFVWLEP